MSATETQPAPTKKGIFSRVGPNTTRSHRQTPPIAIARSFQLAENRRFAAGSSVHRPFVSSGSVRFLVRGEPPPTGAAGSPACDGGRCAADAAEAFAAFSRFSFSPFLGGTPAARALETYSAADSAHAARRLRGRSTRLGALRSPVGQALF